MASNQEGKLPLSLQQRHPSVYQWLDSIPTPPQQPPRPDPTPLEWNVTVNCNYFKNQQQEVESGSIRGGRQSPICDRFGNYIEENDNERGGKHYWKYFWFPAIVLLLFGGTIWKVFFPNASLVTYATQSEVITPGLLNTDGGEGIAPKVCLLPRNLVVESHKPYEGGLLDLDMTGKADLALESLGGLIVSTRDTQVVEKRQVRIAFLGFPIRAAKPIPPETIIRYGVTPGTCWGFTGEKGNVIIQLIKPAIITGIHLEHIHKNLDPYGKLGSAVKEFSIWGLQNYRCLNSAPRTHLGNFTFEPLETPLQYFEINTKQDEIFGQIELEVLSNHGDEITCIYRFRVHGIIEPLWEDGNQGNIV